MYSHYQKNMDDQRVSFAIKMMQLGTETQCIEIDGASSAYRTNGKFR